MVTARAQSPGERRRSKSSFRGIALEQSPSQPLADPLRRPSMTVRFRSTNSIINAQWEPREPMADSDWEDVDDEEDTSKTARPNITTIRKPPPPLLSPDMSVFRSFRLVAIIAAVAILITQQTFMNTRSEQPILGASAAPFSEPRNSQQSTQPVAKRADSPTDVCTRWAQQSALVNGTLYLYGGRRSTTSGQTSGTWNNNFLYLDLTKSWTISSPALTGLAQPSGPPAVALGSLWNSYDSLFLYGGEFSDTPHTTPSANSLWEYDIGSSSWKEHTSPTTSGGANAEAAGQSIERAAEGAGFSMASAGKGWYFGGHLDFLTTQWWSIQTPRLYLKSFVEYTFPGYKTVDGRTAGPDGEWRNITSGGIQDQAGFTERADGILIFVPGYGAQGILLSLAGGTNATFTQMNQVDVFDIATSTWYRQATSGPSPQIRVNPCAVTVAAVDGSSYNVYMFGGQNLIPAGEQTQYSDMWILSVPSFTWMQVDMTGQSVPPGRAGHTCNVWDGQMVMVGGYVGDQLSCDSPGTYVFNLSSLTWNTQFTATSDPKTNPFSQHPNQRGTNTSSGLQGSYGYLVPPLVYKAIGGSSTGGATATKPLQAPTVGPLASGTPVVYPGLSTGSTGNSTSSKAYSNSSNGARIGEIVAGTVAGALLLLAAYLGFCAFIYRKQLKMYKNHIALSQRNSSNSTTYHEKIPHFEPPTGLAAVFTGSPGSWSHGSLLGSGRGSNSDDGRLPPPAATAYDPHRSFGGNSYSALLAPSLHSEQDDEVDLMGGMEPTFVGVMLHPRRSLRVINRD